MKATERIWTGKQLRALREAAGLSQSELSRRVALQPNCEKCKPWTVQTHEGTKNRPPSVPSMSYGAAYAAALGVRIDDLMEEPK
jgi:transcriptional regulator with XRE-family HTH domain